MCGLVESALRRGINVTHIAIVSAKADHAWEVPYSFPAGGGSLRQLDLHYIQNVGTEPERMTFLYRLRRYIRSFCGHFDHSLVRQFVDPLPAALRDEYDGAVAFEPIAASLAKSVRSPYRFAILGDPTGRLLWHSTSNCQVRAKVRALLLDLSEILYFRLTLGKGWRIGMFGTSHARAWSRGLGRPVVDLRPFMPAPPPLPPVSLKENKLIINFGGSLATTASRQSIAPLFDRVLPALIKTLGADHFELRLIGSCPENLSARAAQFPSVRVLGRVPSFEAELAKGHVFLLPMNYPVGVRTRVCSALAAGNVCVLHESILHNMPELLHCDAVKIVNTAELSSGAVMSALERDDLERLRGCAREFFAAHYQADVSSSKILESI